MCSPQKPERTLTRLLALIEMPSGRKKISIGRVPERRPEPQQDCRQQALRRTLAKDIWGRLMRRAVLLLFISLVIVFVSGCGSMTGRHPYPASLWGQLDSERTPDGCPNLSGTYSNLGNASFPSELGEPPRLTDIFMQMAQAGDPLRPGEAMRDWRVPRDAHTVKITQNAEMLTVTFIGGEGASGTLHFRRYHFELSEKRFDDLFTCYTGDDAARLRFFPELDAVRFSDPLYIGGSGTLVFLLRGADGSLVVQLRGESIGLSLLIMGTHFSLDSVWFRYQRVARDTDL